ncbi:metallophosphoesterase family protein [Gottfriedia luciferensis]|uniref:metallophosphoesterase family protein n=1 Tax=Gottfriedia luciferensis TaxID=178774 RepID=UPI000B440BC5|nr:metallophosphoesterase family protein [Gottfriedia luciferensis]
MDKEIVFAIGDIHGSINELEELLKEWNPEKEQLVLLGDLVDRGEHSYDVLVRAQQLEKDYGAVVLLGNHEQMLLDWLEEPELKQAYYYGQGGLETIHSFFKFDITNRKDPNIVAQLMKSEFESELNFIKSRPLYFEWEDYVFVHAGVNLNLADWKDTEDKEFYWIRDEFHYGKNETNKTFVFGHTPTSILHKTEGQFDIWYSPCKTKICIDGAAAYGGFLHGIKVKKDEIISTHSIPSQSNSSKYEI